MRDFADYTGMGDIHSYSSAVLRSRLTAGFWAIWLILASPLVSFGQVQKSDRLPPVEKRPAIEEFSLELPKADELFQVHSEQELKRKIEDDARQRGVKKTEFPDNARLVAKEFDFSTFFSIHSMTMPTGVICYRPLYFQDTSRERGLRSWSIVEPLREALLFYGEGVTLPARMVVVRPWQFQCWNYPFGE
jgi:hypothetical protein